MKQYEEEHLKMVNSNAAECTVLLKTNEKFPLKKPASIDAFGSGLRYTIKGGTGSGEVNSRHTYTIEEGLEKSGFHITSKEWLDHYDIVRAKAKKEFIRQMKKEAKANHTNVVMYAMGKTPKEPEHNLPVTKNSDVAIYVLSRNSGEGSDREPVKGDVKLTDSEVRDILTLDSMYDTFMLVLNVGGVLDLSPVKNVSNILLLSQLGVDCGHILADILLGRQNPSGKLTTTWTAWEDYCRKGTFGEWDETRYKEGIYVGYRYFDSVGKEPLFPFGFGLSYTNFDIHTVSVAADGETINIRAKVRNAGLYSGKEVVQVYMSMPEGKLDQPYQELTAYKKTQLLKPYQEEELTLSFRMSDFASYDEAEETYLLESGEYLIRVGNSSAATEIVAVLSLDETVYTLKAKTLLGKPDFKDAKLRTRSADSTPKHITRINIPAVSFEEKVVNYDVNDEIDERVKRLTDEELGYLVIGGFNLKAKGLSVIGNAATHVAGAAGETTSVLADQGIKPLIMADGPAGIRVSKEYYEDETGAHDATGLGASLESMFDVLNPLARVIARKIAGSKKVPKNAVIKEHAATMIPIGTAIAQSFNEELIESFGRLVGKEMKMMGVHLWLAPALNIHRSILCGRNFEYYSEDPLVSGLTAAAITKGVQAYEGCGTTIKHYAANNAETNRYCNNSQVSERAMREIYLRGFGICVRNSSPHAVMTSYNLLNGTHTSEHKGLIEDILRKEYGFSGIVMTDWVMEVMTSSKSVYRNALSNEVVKAGGDLFMPGGKKDYENVMNDLHNGNLTRTQLEVCATRVVRNIDLLIR